MIRKFVRHAPRLSFLSKPGPGGKWLLTALLLTCECCPAVDEHRLGRLFTTPEQRQRLQELRAERRQTLPGQDNAETGMRVGGRASGTEQTGLAPGTGSDAQTSPVVTLKGLIYRNGGTRIAWVDERAGAAAPEYRELETATAPGNGLAVPVLLDGKSVLLKPGQSYHAASGSVTDIARSSRQVAHDNEQPGPDEQPGAGETTP